MSIKLIRKSSGSKFPSSAQITIIHRNEFIWPCRIDMNSIDTASTCFGDCPQAKKSKKYDEPTSCTSSNWAYLPSIVIHEIFDLLNEDDRRNASTVCKNWRQNVFHPKWWPTITFKIQPRNMVRTRFFTSVFSKICSNVRIKVNTFNPDCIVEFITLLEALSDNNNLKELIIESTHCHFDISRCDQPTRYNIANVIETLKRCLIITNLTKFSIGCIEDFAYYLDEYLTILTTKHQANKITHLGLASVKDNPNEYEAPYFDNNLLRTFSNLQIISIDFDQLSDQFLASLDAATGLERVIVHLHGVREAHPGTSNEQWARFRQKHPKCELRLNVIHSYDEIGVLHETVLKEQMPLSHLKVFFCENMNMDVLDFISTFYTETIRSIMWVDSLCNSEQSWSFFANEYENSPDPLIMISWLCKNLEELVFYGYKYCEENLIAIARLRGDKLKKFEFIENDIMLYTGENYELRKSFVIDIPLHLKRPWSPVKISKLPAVIFNAKFGDSDEYILPIVQADMH